MKDSLWPTASLLEACRDAANRGVATAAASLAQTMRAQGLAATAQAGRVTIEGAGVVAREFGTLTRAATPVVSPIVRANAQEIVRIVGAEIGATK